MSSTVLVVEDDTDIREMLAEVLQDEGYHVLTAWDGRAALNVLTTTPKLPCLIVTDLMMPAMNGWELCRERLNDPRLAPIPVIVISAVRNLTDQIGALGVIAAIPKPLDLEKLLSTILHTCPPL